MHTVILAMHRRPVAQMLISKIRENPGIQAVFEPDYDTVVDDAVGYGAGAVLIEVAEAGAYDAGFCLALCARLREQAPLCRLLLLCPEQDEPSVSAMVEALRDGHIDDFFFYDTGIDYIVSKLHTHDRQQG